MNRYRNAGLVALLAAAAGPCCGLGLVISLPVAVGALRSARGAEDAEQRGLAWLALALAGGQLAWHLALWLTWCSALNG